MNDGGAPLAGEALAAARRRLDIRLLEQPGGGPAAARNRGAGRSIRCGSRLHRRRLRAGASGWLEAIEQRLGRDPDVLVAGRAASLHPDNDFGDRGAAADRPPAPLVQPRPRAPAASRRRTTSRCRAETFHALRRIRRELSRPRRPRIASSPSARCGPGTGWCSSRARSSGHRHRLTARAFLRQHYGYGRGARRVLRGAPPRPAAGCTVEPPAFYTQMLELPWREHHGPRAARLAVLLAASQAAHTAGFVGRGASEGNPGRV